MIFNRDYILGVVLQELHEDFSDALGHPIVTKEMIEEYASQMLDAFEAHNIVVVKSSPLSY